jgi:hypothetical protein
MVSRNKADVVPEKALRERLKRAAAEYAALRTNRENEVVRWQWASDPYFDLRPYDAEVTGFNDLSWEGKLPVTDDFVVYAADVEKGGTIEELAACVPSARLSVLRERKLL